MNTKTRCLLEVYIVITVVFVSVVLLNQRGFADSWILQDVFTATMIYILTFSIVVVAVDDNRVVALVCGSFIIILNAIPNLKYQLFYGTYDSVAHYGVIKNLLSLGFVPETGYYASAYSDFPGMHIFTGSLSLVLGISVNASMKLATSTIFGVIPLMTYFATKGVFERNIQKYIVTASGLPTVMSYALSGTIFAIPLFFSFLCLLLKRTLVNKNKKEYSLALIILTFGLIFSHAVSTMSLILILGMALVIIKSIDYIKRCFQYSLMSMYTQTWILLTVSFAAWLIFRAGFVLEMFTAALHRVLFYEITEPIPERFLEIPLSAQLRFLALYHLADAIIVVLAFAGLFVLLKKFKLKNEFSFRNFYIPLLSLMSATLPFLTLSIVAGKNILGTREYRRFIGYAMVFSPFVVGLFLWYLNERFRIRFRRIRVRSIALSSVLFVCISLSLIQLFPYQPLVPGANVLSRDLPENTYILDLRSINTIYQVKMISFAERFSSSDTYIVSDKVTRKQIFGFANESFASRSIYYDPLEADMNKENLKWGGFLLHYGERSGPLNEKAEHRTREAIKKLRDALVNVVYDNGESFMLLSFSQARWN